MTATVDVQWALYGKTVEAGGSLVLSNSKGILTRENFGEAIRRFSPGTPDVFPQVTVSYVATGEADGNFIALAIHHLTDAAHGARWDEAGRPLTSYFCVPYLSLANAAIGYLPLYQELRTIWLPTSGTGQPLRVSLAAATRAAIPPGLNALAKQVAALLLTSRPVCILGANSAPADERLRFIDTVMDLLPYGQRTRMTATTWVRPTNRDHRFRLYFSNAVRDHTPPDHVVWWNRPDQTVLTSAHGAAWEYQRFLEDETGQATTRLSGLTNPHGFKLDDLREILTDLGIDDADRATVKDPDDVGRVPPGLWRRRTANAADDEEPVPVSAGLVLRSCAAHIEELNLSRLAADIHRLQALARDGHPGDRDRARYRKLVVRRGLLRPHAGLGEHEGPLYEAVLTLAFGTALGYPAYCQVEDCLGNPPGEPPHVSLLHSIEQLGSEDTRVTALVHGYLTNGQRSPNQLPAPLSDGTWLINLLAKKWERPEHFRVVCDMTLNYLADDSDCQDQAAIRRALKQHGFLARTMQESGCHDQYQVHALYRLITIAYPDGLSRTAITTVLRPAGRVTAALFAAVLMLLTSPQDAQLARGAYAVASLTDLSLDHETATRLLPLVPTIYQASGSFINTRMEQAKGTKGTGNDIPGPGR